MKSFSSWNIPRKGIVSMSRLQSPKDSKMKNQILTITLLITVCFAACTPLAQPAATQVNKPDPTTVITGDEEGEIRELVENFGKRLQMVSLLAPTAAEDLQRQYAEFVSPALLETWINDVSNAPGRMVSSPWPDRIEITNLKKEAADRYVIDGFVVEVTSTEVNNDEAANKIPVHIVVERNQEHWLIAEYVEEN
jgi:hypothetical protein